MLQGSAGNHQLLESVSIDEREKHNESDGVNY